jgi:hypothetical protein
MAEEVLASSIGNEMKAKFQRIGIVIWPAHARKKTGWRSVARTFRKRLCVPYLSPAVP